MGFTHDEYKAQGLYPPCQGAIYIPSSSPFTEGDVCLDKATSVLYVAWAQQVMKTGGVWTSRLWWVPQSELPIQPLP